MPWGGFGGDSGAGRDLGRAAIENYTEQKAVWLYLGKAVQRIEQHLGRPEARRSPRDAAVCYPPGYSANSAAIIGSRVRGSRARSFAAR